MSKALILLNRIITYIQKQFSLDARALSLMRICLGLVLIADWLIRFNSITAHYTNEGVLPTGLLFERQWKDGFFSLFLISDSVVWCYFLFFLAIVSSFFFTIGYFTRFFNLLSWILLCSIHVRQPFVLQGGDELLRIALFWSLFLPLNRKYSVDAVQRPHEISLKVFSAAGFGFMILVFSVYFFSAILKTSEEWQGEGTAIYYALSLDQMVLPLGKVLLKFPLLCKLLTHFVFWTELLAPLLFFVPYKNGVFRTLGIALLLVMHLGIGITLFVGLFFLIGISTLVGILPEGATDKLLRRAPAFLKKKNGFGWFAGWLPSFPALRLKYAQLLTSVSNFYTETILNFTLIFIMCICLIWNLGNIKSTGLTVSGPFRRMVYFLRIDQNWGMFSPSVFKDDGWFVLEASMAGKKIDIYRDGREADYGKPEHVLDGIRDDRWRKYEENYIMVDYAYIRPYYCSYLIRSWNKEHPQQQIDSLRIIYMKERTLPDYKPSVATKELLCNCTK